jgi:hypothetical protein
MLKVSNVLEAEELGIVDERMGVNKEEKRIPGFQTDAKKQLSAHEIQHDNCLSHEGAHGQKRITVESRGKSKRQLSCTQ